MNEAERNIASLEKLVEESHRAGALAGNKGWDWLRDYLTQEINRCTTALLKPDSTREDDLMNKAKVKAYTDLIGKVENTQKKGVKATEQLEKLKKDNS